MHTVHSGINNIRICTHRPPLAPLATPTGPLLAPRLAKALLLFLLQRLLSVPSPPPFIL